MQYQTRFGTLAGYEKGYIEAIDDKPRRYAFSNVFEVAALAEPYEQVAVGKNMEYVIEAIRAEGTSGWRTCAHDQFALVMDGEVEIQFTKLAAPLAPAGKEGSIAVPGEPDGPRMGRVVCRQGHQALLPKDAAYRFVATGVSVMIIQTILGEDTVQRWDEICLS
jgi:hypothetical protein